MKLFNSLLMTCITVPIFAQQQVQIGGTVLDASDMPIIGASILEKGTTNGTITDLDGKFSLLVSSEDAMLQISYMGYMTQEVPVSQALNTSWGG